MNRDVCEHDAPLTQYCERCDINERKHLLAVQAAAEQPIGYLHPYGVTGLQQARKRGEKRWGTPCHPCPEEGLDGKAVPVYLRPALSTMNHAPTLGDFCEVANNLYADPTEGHFYAVVNLARELLAQASMRWDDGYKFARGQTQPVGWLVDWPSTSGKEPHYRHGPKKPSYGAELDALGTFRPVYASTDQ